MSAAMTGWREADGGGGRLVLERRFRAPREDVWAAVTEPGRLERWIGTWSGDPADGQVAFRMTAEGEDVAAETMRIEECEPPSRLRLVSDGWVLELDLAETPTADGVVTTLRFAQVMPLPESAARRSDRAGSTTSTASPRSWPGGTRPGWPGTTTRRSERRTPRPSPTTEGPGVSSGSQERAVAWRAQLT